MPELPEVEVIVRELREKLKGETIAAGTVLWHRSLVNDDNLILRNKTITKIGRRGKYIIFYLNTGYLITHLRMTGQLIVVHDADYDTKHLRIVFHLESGKYLLFYDLRKFGRIYLTKNPESVFKNVGIDALSPDFTDSELTTILSDKKAKIKTLLLDQSYIAGLGNIYIDESLFRARIHPETAAGDIIDGKVKSLHGAIMDVLEDAISNMGTTISDYKTTGGGFGTNQKMLRVYQRESKPCYTCKTPIKKIKLNGRGTHYCPVCQQKNGT